MLPPEFDLSGRVALVTGGGTGIGRATALLLAERGADVAVSGRRREPLAATVHDIEALGRKALAVEADVRDVASVHAMVAAVIARFGKLDILINNAGGAHRHVALAKMDPARWDRDVQLNLSAAMYCSQAALPHLKAGKGCVVNVSSLAGMHGTQGVAAYSAAKAGLQMFTRVASAEWGPSGVRVNCVAPGMTATEAAREGWEKHGFDAMAACGAFPLRRYGEMREVAQMIVFFASDAASYITGESVAVGGGPQIGGMIRVED
ncbi:SDR family NAD(P)-dependent oxidoreductase [Novosphingobium album (ex Liu et al. 2023)]|uniref:SDR family NAD(P)-dependent oxidoreductase n=1 Tax=Novosphingobium album (ex Liu et al. 2023) TaxID=3031130 RepID=A0ABT5WLZ0_9SPHN|nr:SDR family NAD(P)-dependent oxidoreductase [Novosphingobium album (ex Liu et al. 2023)]MDE8651047.1 SDR family NAD(P)-dependent oxidoreductase [Novosphingobium album (ex Liu et al. 2023)]